MASDDTDILLFAALGLGAWYFYSKSKEEAQRQRQQQQTVLVGEPQPDPGLPYTGPMPDPMVLPETPGADVISKIGQVAMGLSPLLATIPVAGPILAVAAPLGIAGGVVGLTAGAEIIGGNLSTGNILTTGALLSGVGTIPALFALGIGKLFHIDLFGHDLDQVNKILLNAFNSPTTRDNVQFGQPIYVLAEDGTLREVKGDLTKLGFSWRAIIAVDQRIIDVFQKGEPVTRVQTKADTWQPGFKPSGRPKDSLGLRKFFGKDILFKLGNSNDLHGPWEADVQNVVNAGYQAGGPADLVFGDIKGQVVAETAEQAAAVQASAAVRRARF